MVVEALTKHTTILATKTVNKMKEESMQQNYIILKPISSNENHYYMNDGSFRCIGFVSLDEIKEFEQFHDATETVKTLSPGVYFVQRYFRVDESQPEKKDELTEFDHLLLIEVSLKEADVLPFKERVKAKKAILDRYQIIKKNKEMNLEIEPIKFTWEKTDTFDTIHKKLLEMKGASVVNKLNEKEPLTIFNIGQIEEMELTGLGDGFAKFLDGDENYQTKDGGYNFRGMKIVPMWGFFVEFGMEDKNGTRMYMKYNFMIPRNNTYEKDVKVNSIVIDENHPFVFYSLQKQKIKKKVVKSSCPAAFANTLVSSI